MEGKKDLAYTIIEERLDFAIGLIKEMAKKHNLDLTAGEIMDNARNISVSMFIQKERAYKS